MTSPTFQNAIVISQSESGEMFCVTAVLRHFQILVLSVLFLYIYSATLNSTIFLVMALIGSILACTLGASGLRSDRYSEDLDNEEEFEMH